MRVQPFENSFVLKPSNRNPQQLHVFFTDRRPPIRKRLYSDDDSDNNSEDESEDEDIENFRLEKSSSPRTVSKASSPDTTAAVKQRSSLKKKDQQWQRQKQKRVDHEDEDEGSASLMLPPAPQPPTTTTASAVTSHNNKRQRISPPPVSTSQPPTRRPRTTVLPWNKAILDTSTPNWMIDSVRRELNGLAAPQQSQYIRHHSHHPDFEPPSDHWKKRCFYWQDICQQQRKRLRELEEDQRQLRRKVWQLEEQVIWTANRSSTRIAQRFQQQQHHDVAVQSSSPQQPAAAQEEEEGEQVQPQSQMGTTGEDEQPPLEHHKTLQVPVTPDESKVEPQHMNGPPIWIITIPQPHKCSFYLTDGEGLSDSEEYEDNDDDGVDVGMDGCDDDCHYHHHHQEDDNNETKDKVDVPGSTTVVEPSQECHVSNDETHQETKTTAIESTPKAEQPEMAATSAENKEMKYDESAEDAIKEEGS